MQNNNELIATGLIVKNDNDHLKEIIIRYVEEDSVNPYALMITGDWGCGKTYYLKEVIKPHLEKDPINKKLLYVSLNGVSSISEIYEQLFSEKYKAVKFLKDNKFARITTKLIKSSLNVAMRAIKVKSTHDNFDDFEAEPTDLPSITAQELGDFSNNVIVFDDLERISSKINISDVLGFINTNFIEHDKIKVVIVSDTSRIKDTKFEETKEKVIGRVIEFRPQAIRISESYMEGITDEELKYFFKINKSFILERINQAEITNLRGLFFFFDSLKAILSLLPQNLQDKFGSQIVLWTLIYSNEFKKGSISDFSESTGLPHYYNYFNFDYENIVLDSFTITEEFKKKVRLKEEEKIKQKEFERKYKPLEGGLPSPIPGILTFVKEGYLDKEAIVGALRIQIVYQPLPEIEALIKINPFDDSHLSLNDEEFTKYLSIVTQAVFDKKYSFSQFIKAFQTLVKLEEEDFLALTGNELLEKYTDIEDFFVKNLWETKDALEYWEFTHNIQSAAQRDGFEFLMPIKYSSLYHKVKEIYDSLESKYIKEEYEKKFPSFDTNPFLYEIPWNDLELLIQVADVDRLAQLIKSALFNTPKQLCEIFRDWPPSKKKVTIIKLDVILEKVEGIKTDVDEYTKVIDFSGKPMSKHWLNQLIPHLQRKIDLLKGLVSTSS